MTPSATSPATSPERACAACGTTRAHLDRCTESDGSTDWLCEVCIAFARSDVGRACGAHIVAVEKVP